MVGHIAHNIQDPFLNTLRREKVPVTVFLVNGVKLQGVITSFDNYCMLLKNSVTQLVFKHAISTIMPSRNIFFPTDDPNGLEHHPEATS